MAYSNFYKVCHTYKIESNRAVPKLGQLLRCEQKITIAVDDNILEVGDFLVKAFLKDKLELRYGLYAERKLPNYLKNTYSLEIICYLWVFPFCRRFTRKYLTGLDFKISLYSDFHAHLHPNACLQRWHLSHYTGFIKSNTNSSIESLMWPTLKQ